MNTAGHFSEAAKLYARNFKLVEQMKRGYENELNRFADRLEQRVQSLVKPAKVLRKNNNRNQEVVLWIGEDLEKERDGKGACLWFDTIPQPEIIQGQFAITVGTDCDEERLRIIQLADHPDFAPSSNLYKTSRRSTGYTWFNVQIDLSSGDAVEVAAARLAKMLQALDAARKG
jgi:hypothetical protein